MSRPEDTLPADLHYDDASARKYTTSTRIKNIQSQMTHRALELLSLDRPSHILDIGCGSGLSGEILSTIEPEDGGPHVWSGMDVSSSMLAEALGRDVEGDLFLADIGQGIPFRPGTFDAAISISAIQWLCYADTSDVSPEGRLKRFFDGLFVSLKRGGKAVCQFYPKDKRQRDMIVGAAIKAGFGAGILEDDPETKSAKLYLVLTIGGADDAGQRNADVTDMVKGLDGVDVLDNRAKGSKRRSRMDKTDRKGSKGYIMKKKEKMARQGKIVKPSSKYTGRRRKTAF